VRPGVAKLLLRPGSEILLHLNQGGEKDDDNDDDVNDDYNNYHNNIYIHTHTHKYINVYACVCVCVQRGAAAPLPEVLSILPLATLHLALTEKRVPVLARFRLDGRLVVSLEGHGVLTVSHYRWNHKICCLGAKENGPG